MHSKSRSRSLEAFFHLVKRPEREVPIEQFSQTENTATGNEEKKPWKNLHKFVEIKIQKTHENEQKLFPYEMKMSQINQIIPCFIFDNITMG